MLIALVILKMIVSAGFLYLARECSYKINMIDSSTHHGIRWGYVIKRAGAVAIALGIWTLDPFAVYAALLYPAGFTLLSIYDKTHKCPVIDGACKLYKKFKVIEG